MTTADSLNDRVERTIGADVRLLYALGVPMLAATGFIIAYTLSGSWVLLGLVALFVFLAAGVVVVGILQMLREGDAPDATPTDDPAVDPKGASMPILTPEKQPETQPAPVVEEAPSPDRGGRQAFALIGGAAVIVALAIVALVVALGSGGTKKTAAAVSKPAVAPAATATTVVTPAARVSVSLREFKVTPSATVGKAGRITFKVSNAGQITHEFVVLRTTHPAAALPFKGGRADEAGNVGETGDLVAGQTKAIALKLKPGHYALVCNLPGHYKAGQHTDFTVK